MKKLFLLVFIPFFSFITPAQDNNYKTKAVSFSFNGLNLSSYYGGVGGRFWVSDKFVLNVSVGGSFKERKYLATENLSDGYEKTTSVNFGIGLENHYPIIDNLSSYFSYRFSLSLFNRYNRSANINGEVKDKSNYYSFEFGLGIEYWLLDRISLSGQHLFNIYKEKGERTYFGDPVEYQDLSGAGFGSGTTSIMLSIYF